MISTARTPRRYFSGCCDHAQVASTSPCIPATGAIIADNAYFSLQKATAVQVLGVPLGSNTQAFLEGSVAGFLVYGSDGQVRVTAAPAVNLPVINPAVASVHPVPGSVQFIAVGGAGNPTALMYAAAPTSGEYVLRTKNGSWILEDYGAIPGLEAIGASATYTNKGQVLGVVETAPGEYAVRKITATHGKVMVGDVDGSTSGYKALLSTEFLKHEKVQAGEFRTYTFAQDNIDGTETAGGLPVHIAYGAGAITDTEVVRYSPSSKKFFKGAEKTARTYHQTGPVAVVTDGTWKEMGGHAKIANVVVNYPKLMAMASIRLDHPDEYAEHDFAFFLDGIEVAPVFQVFPVKENTVHKIFEGITPGVHTIEVRIRSLAGANADVVDSQIDLFTVGE